jgi:hypothetical protein
LHEATMAHFPWVVQEDRQRSLLSLRATGATLCHAVMLPVRRFDNEARPRESRRGSDTA